MQRRAHFDVTMYILKYMVAGPLTSTAFSFMKLYVIQLQSLEYGTFNDGKLNVAGVPSLNETNFNFRPIKY